MPTSGIVPIPCSAAREGVVELPADSKSLSKLSGARAGQVARRKVLEHVALGHGNRVVVQCESPPLVGITSLPVASLLVPITSTFGANYIYLWRQLHLPLALITSTFGA